MEPSTSDLTRFDRSVLGAVMDVDPDGVAQSLTDGQLVLRAVSGDRSAFDDLVRRYQRQAVAVSYRLLGNVQDALEVTQDAFFKAFRSLATLEKPEAFGGWLLRIVSNLSLNYRRSRKNQNQLPLDDFMGSSEQGQASNGIQVAQAWGDPARSLRGKELGQKLQSALQQLPEKQRQALLMFTVDQVPQKDVASALNCTVEAVKWHVFQGRKRLRDILKDQLIE